MKFLFLTALLCLTVGADAQTYRAGGSSRPRFGASANQETQESAVPGAQSNIKTRTFSNYSSRQRNWSQGVQTQPVRTETAGSTPNFPDQAEEKAAAAVAGLTQPTGASASANTGKQTSSSAAPQAAAPATSQTAAQPAAAQAAADSNAMLQQVQGLLKGMGASSGTAAGAMPAGLNVPGMPDMSALLQAASAGQQPGAQK